MYRPYWLYYRDTDAAIWSSANRARRRPEVAITALLALYAVVIIAALVALS